MLNFLIQHAVNNVWCSPQQDKQYIIKPFRLSRTVGALDYQKVMWERVTLPSFDERYHVFQIGHIHPKLLGVMTEKRGWVKLSDLINETNLMGEVYFVDGRIVPRGLCYLRYDDQKNLILAIREHLRFTGLRTKDVYFRTYTNALFESERVDINVDRTFVKGYTALDNSAILSLQNEFNQAKALKGQAVGFLNGYLVDDFNIGRVQPGDYIEYVHDTTIYRVLDFKVSDLKVFDSILDGKRKYLLTYDGEDNQSIDFEDDIDLYLFKVETNGRYTGTHYHRNNFDAIRMLTHKDYSVPVDYIQSYSDTNSQWDDPNDLTLRLYVREAGLARPLIQEHNRVFELYKLPHSKVERAMLGIDSTVDVWRAEQLEMSAYVKLMRARSLMLDPSIVRDAYGYNSASRILGETPVAVDSSDGAPKIQLPVGLRSRVTVYEYNVDGLLLGYHTHSLGATYVCSNPQAAYCEVIAGFARNKLSAVFGESTHHLSPHISYRAYTCTLLGNGPAWDWKDAFISGEAQVNGNELTFDVNTSVVYTAVVSDRDFVGYNLTLGQKNGVYKFTVSSLETHDGVEDQYITTIPPRTIEVWLNGHSLVEDIDFIVSWPEVTIINKKYLVGEGDQAVTVRCTGFSDDELKLDKPIDTGFVKHGLISYNDTFTIKDDRVFRCTVDGKLKLRNQVTFHEDVDGDSWLKAAEGTPYSISEIIVPMRGYVNKETYVYRKESIPVDIQVGEYMSVVYPLAEVSSERDPFDKHVLYSPFLARVINNVVEGIIPEQNIRTHYNDSQIQSWLESEHYLLDFDPLYLGYDEDHVIVHPHRYSNPLDIDVYQRNFFHRVVELYFDGEINIDDYVNVVTNP